MKITIEKIGINGEGIGYLNQKPIFIENALPKEEVEVRVLEDYNSYKIGEVNRFIKQTYDRIRPKCKYFDSCGACNMMHAKYERQLEYKQSLIQQALIKYAQVNPNKIQKIIASTREMGYRNSLKIPFGVDKNKLSTGMFASRSNYFVPIGECIVHEEHLEWMKKRVLSILNKHHFEAFDNYHKNGIRYLIIRELQGKAQITIVSGIVDIPQICIEEIMDLEGVVSLWQSHNPSKKSTDLFGNKLIALAGKKKLSFRFMGYRLQLSPKSFFQLNTLQAQTLYEYVMSVVPSDQSLIVEAYCGIGVMSLLASTKSKEVIGIEFVKDAISNAIKNAQRNDIANVSFVAGDAAKECIKINNTRSIDTLIVDPPRSGLDESMIRFLNTKGVDHLVYISCNSATLAKNIKMLETNYEVVSVQPFDMFSQTAHIESVTHMKRKKLSR